MIIIESNNGTEYLESSNIVRIIANTTDGVTVTLVTGKQIQYHVKQTRVGHEMEFVQMTEEQMGKLNSRLMRL